VILGIDHVGIAVRDAGEAAGTFSRLTGDPGTPVEALPEQGVRLCFVPAHALVRFELLEPAAEGSAIDRFVARRGEGMHHVCLVVDDLRAEMARLAADGFQLIDREPRQGHGGQVAFLHPHSALGVLIELLQRD
jgi:methylmalonyl-CoA/ethylmalonyl-CoA epimerase